MTLFAVVGFAHFRRQMMEYATERHFRGGGGMLCATYAKKAPATTSTRRNPLVCIMCIIFIIYNCTFAFNPRRNDLSRQTRPFLFLF